MRRKDREITGRENIEPILRACKTCRVAMIADGAPYVVPLNFGYTWDDDGLTLYFHSGLKGKKIDALRADREKSWTMQPDGTYRRAETVPGTASHDTLYEYFGEKTVEPLPPEKKHGWLWRLFHPNKKKLHGNEA